MDKTQLGDRMKSYEQEYRTYVPEKQFTIIRLDGKAFHTYTRGLNKPYDFDLIEDMAETTKYLCENIQGAWWGYTQSDEITILLTPFAKETSSAWFNGNVQKMTTVSASMATAKFNELRRKRFEDYAKSCEEDPFGQIDKRYDFEFAKFKMALFDSRIALVTESKEEAMNNLIWRQRDAIKNSISMAAQAVYSHKQLNKKTGTDKLQMLADKGIDWNDYPDSAKRGTIVRKYRKTYNNNGQYKNQPEQFERTFWVAEGAFEFKVDGDLDQLIPSPGYGYKDRIKELVPQL